MKPQDLLTHNENTWCPGCHNFFVLEAVKKALANLNPKQENLAMVTGIGCHAKIFDYLNISGIYGLHGRVLPTALGLKLGNPNLTVLGFAGDGDTYAEGMGHFIHACRYNANFTLIVHDNQTFALTTGQATPTSQKGFKNKAEPLGEFNFPLNPARLALTSGATFIARAYPKNLEHTQKILEKAIKHNGFSFVELLQPCLQFNTKLNKLQGSLHIIQDNKDDMKKALELTNEYDYDLENPKVPLGIFYQVKKPTLEEKWPQLQNLMQKKVGWAGLGK